MEPVPGAASTRTTGLQEGERRTPANIRGRPLSPRIDASAAALVPDVPTGPRFVVSLNPGRLRSIFRSGNNGPRSTRPDIQLPRPRQLGISIASGRRPENRLQSMEAINAAISALPSPASLEDLRASAQDHVDRWLDDVDRSRPAYLLSFP
jgi:hypothetical protein